MKKVFFVEDDALIVEIYRKKFLQAGFQVDVAEDGLAAMKLLPVTKPDLIVLDLMMPKFSGVDVLKYIRSHRDLKSTPVIILSNAYMSDMTQAAAIAGADKALLKSRCTPAALIDVVNNILAGAAVTEDTSLLIAAADVTPAPVAASRAPAPSPAAPASAGAPLPTPAQEPVKLPEAPASPELQAKTHADFLENAPATLKTIRELFHAFVNCIDPKTRPLRLLDLYRKVHFLTSMAGMAGCVQISQFASALAALLFELHERPDLISGSTLQTLAYSVDFLTDLYEHADEPSAGDMKLGKILVVDDDLVSNRVMSSVLLRAHFEAASADDPLKALKKLQEDHYDLIFLDILMPGMDGFELFTKLRSLPGYSKVPVIFVTSHADFENRARSVLIGGNDLIAKPILPIELAVKAVTHLLRRQFSKLPGKA